MRNVIGLISIVGMLLMAYSFLFFATEKVAAIDPSYPDQGCVNGVQNSGVSTWASQTPGMVFVPRFNWLNAVSVRIKGTNPTGTPRIEAQIWNWHSNPHQMIARHSVDLENRIDEYWQYIEESSQDIDPGLEYAIILVPKNGSQVYWSATTNTSCYAPGYAMIDGTRLNSIDYGFATYGYYDPNNPSSDGSAADPGTPDSGSTTNPAGSAGAITTDPVASSGSSSGSGTTGSSGSSSSGSGTSGSSSKSTGTTTTAPKSSFVPDIAAILADHGANKDSGGIAGFLANVFSSPIMIILWPLLSLLFWIGVIVFIIVLIRRRKKKNQVASVTTASQPAKPEEKKK